MGLPPTTSAYHRALHQGIGRTEGIGASGGVSSPVLAGAQPDHIVDHHRVAIRQRHPPLPHDGQTVRGRIVVSGIQGPNDEARLRAELAERLGVTTSHYLRLEARRAHEAAMVSSFTSAPRSSRGSSTAPNLAPSGVDPPTQHRAASAGAVRRRIRGKQSMPQAGDGAGSVDEKANKWCRPVSRSGWSGRLKPAASANMADCHLCGRPCRCLCRGCSRRLCYSCASTAAHCER